MLISKCKQYKHQYQSTIIKENYLHIKLKSPKNLGDIVEV